MDFCTKPSLSICLTDFIACKKKQNAMKLIKRRPQQIASQPSQAGFTIIESLVAMIVVAILMSAIGPVIVLATATRIQSRRVELATQAAKAYTDAVSAGSVEAPDPANKDIGTVDAPTASLPSSCDSGKYCGSTKILYCIDGDNDGKCTNTSAKDLIIQAFRTGATDDAKSGYGLGLRVYRAGAFQTGIVLKASKDIKDQDKDKIGKQQNSFTGGIGDRQAPLVEMTTAIATGKTTFGDFCTRFKDPKNSSSGC
jgi:prepilin-type N-terminal cleavage/methylation domain-containing protein